MDRPSTSVQPNIELLTQREREALRWVAEHRLSKEIGPLMGVSKSRADALVESACRKLGVNARGRARADRAGACRLQPGPTEPKLRKSGRAQLWD